jgi:nucleoside-diphosphate-sugar epimerase
VVDLARPIVVLGGSGFIGRRLCAELARRGARPIVADVMPVAGFEYLRADVAELRDVCEAIAAHRPSVVVNLAYRLGTETEADMFLAASVNVMGMANVFEACRFFGVDRCVYASSIAVYGDQPDWGDREVVEEDHGSPSILYGWQKQLNEATAARYQRSHGIRCIGLRISTVYGPGRVNGMTAPITRMIEAAGRGEVAHSPYGPSSDSNLVYVDDVAFALAELATAPNPAHDIYNTGGEFATIGQIADLVRELRPGARIEIGPDGPRIPHVSRVGWNRLRDEFGVERLDLRRRLQEWLRATEGAERPGAPTTSS